MVDPNELHAIVFNRLKAISELGGRVHDGYVPDKIATDAAGYVLPYVVVFSGIGSDLPAERDLTMLDDVGVLDWATQTTCVGPAPPQCLGVAQLVRSSLQNLPIGRGWLQTDVEAFRTVTPIRDTTITPARFFLPLRWRLITT